MSLLPSASQFLNLIKKAAVEAVEQSRPMQIVYGTVTSKSPIEIRLDQQRTLSSNFLVWLDFGGAVSGTGDAVSVYSFSKGDKVALLQQKGGQEYLVLGKAVR